MAVNKNGKSGLGYVESKPKTTRQGRSKNTNYAATSRNSRGKKYRGQGK